MTGQNVKTGNKIVNLFTGERCMPATKVPIDQFASSCGSLLDFGPASFFLLRRRRNACKDMILCIVSLRSCVLERESLLSVCWEFVFVIMFARDDVQHAFRVL